MFGVGNKNGNVKESLTFPEMFNDPGLSTKTKHFQTFPNISMEMGKKLNVQGCYKLISLFLLTKISIIDTNTETQTCPDQHFKWMKQNTKKTPTI